MPVEVEGSTAHKTAESVAALDLVDVSKHFGTTPVLHNVSLRIEPGEVRGLVGANGSGKSTLVKILSGYHHPDDGAAGFIWGQPLAFPVHRPFEAGITIVHQDLALVANLTVKEHLAEALGYGGSRWINWRDMKRQCQAILETVATPIDLDAMIKDLHPTTRALLAIVRETARTSRSSAGRQLLIFDEAEAYVDTKERDIVHGFIRRIAGVGGAVMIISHRLGDVLNVCDTVSILRDGRCVDTVKSEGAIEEDLAVAMLGTKSAERTERRASITTAQSPVAMRTESLVGRELRNLTLDLRQGECLGITGMPGSGHEELPYLLVGARPVQSGQLIINGDEAKHISPEKMLRAGVALLPPDRRGQGGWSNGTASENMSIVSLAEFWKGGFLRPRAEKTRSRQIMSGLGVSPARPDQEFERFSGGNQQRILLGRWAMRKPKILVMVSPTEAVDIRAREYILDTFIPEFCQSGGSILIASSDYEELSEVCDRVCVLLPGGGTAYLEGDEIDPDRMFRLSNGLGTT